MVTEDQVKAKELGERLGKLFQVLMNKSFLNPEVREEIEEILGRTGLSKDVLEDVIHDIQDVALELIDEAPYLSPNQSDELTADLERLLNELADIDLEGVTDPVECFKEKCLDIKSKIGTQDFPFHLKIIPEDVYKALEDISKDLIKAVIKNVFGRLMSNLSGDERLRLEVQIDQAIEQEIARFNR